VSEALPTELSERLRHFSRRPVLLVSSDYDGVVASYADTHVAVVSGRSRGDLAALSGLPAGIHLVGSHGAEFDAAFTQNLTEEQLALRSRILDRFTELAAQDAAFEIESKPASIAFHYRRVEDRELADRVVAEISSTIGVEPGVHAKLGKQVVELAVVETDKGTALATLRSQVGADAVFFMGDDVTDEDAFRTLDDDDISIKIGPGTTAAAFRLATPQAAAHTLTVLNEMRAEWVEPTPRTKTASN